MNGFQLKGKQGIGLILFFCATLLLAPLAFLLSIGRYYGKRSLRKVPKLQLTDKTAFGSSLFWGTVVLLFGILLFTPSFAGEQQFEEPFDYYVLLIAISLTGTGFLLLIDWISYNKYIKQMKDLLEMLSNETSPIQKNSCILQSDKESFSFEQLKPLLEDLQECHIISLFEKEQQLYFTIQGKEENPTNSSETIDWICSSCGGKNSVLDSEESSFVCAYCETVYIK
ncbi:hypothetical protein LJC35_02495 [Parabacteroides sp. OttesenSCG-928-N08]|nr:hypothetical protein [Parabacteroides sp. OttesenSCG-928-N08]